MFAQYVRRSFNSVERTSRPCGDIQQAMASIRQIEHPEHRQFISPPLWTSYCSIESALSQLRLAFGILIEIRQIALQHRKNRQTLCEGIGEMLWLNKVQIIS